MGREPTLGELEHETGIPQEKLDKVKGSWADTPLRWMAGGATKMDGRSSTSACRAEGSCPVAVRGPYASHKWNAEVRRLLTTTLTPIEVRIIRWRFGLDDGRRADAQRNRP